eukprot:1181106-Prorocentrum_minimum.AAC.2
MDRVSHEDHCCMSTGGGPLARARHGPMSSGKNWRENRILSRVIRWRSKVLLTVNSSVSVSSPTARVHFGNAPLYCGVLTALTGCLTACLTE